MMNEQPGLDNWLVHQREKSRNEPFPIQIRVDILKDQQCTLLSTREFHRRCRGLFWETLKSPSKEKMKQLLLFWYCCSDAIICKNKCPVRQSLQIPRRFWVSRRYKHKKTKNTTASRRAAGDGGEGLFILSRRNRNVDQAEGNGGE